MMRKKLDEDMASIGSHIRVARQRANLTQEQLAELTGTTPQYLSNLERGIVGTSIPTLIRICRTLNVTSDFILFGIDEEKDREIAILLERVRYMPKYKADIIEQGLDLLIRAIETDPQKRE